MIKKYAFFVSLTAVLSFGLFFSGRIIFSASHNTVAAIHREISPKRGPSGIALRGPHNSLESTNWSGYVTPSYVTGQQYTSASSTWVVPAVSTTSSGYSSSWVGIGGFCLNASCKRVDHTLIQLGTEQDSAGNYYAWYEMLPNPEVKITGFSVNPGDKVVASLSLQPVAAIVNGKNKNNQGGNSGNHGGSHGGTTSSSTWLLIMTDETTGATWSGTFNYKSSLASAEWIEEAPYSAGILPLANFGKATFDPGTVNGGQNPNLTDTESVVMFNPNGQTSNVSVPDSDTDGFNACWGNGNVLTTPCSPPSS